MSAFLHRSLQVWRQRSVALFANNSKTGWKTPLFFWRNTLSIFNVDHKTAKTIGKKWRRGSLPNRSSSHWLRFIFLVAQDLTPHFAPHKNQGYWSRFLIRFGLCWRGWGLEWPGLRLGSTVYLIGWRRRLGGNLSGDLLQKTSFL